MFIFSLWNYLLVLGGCAPVLQTLQSTDLYLYPNNVHSQLCFLKFLRPATFFPNPFSVIWWVNQNSNKFIYHRLIFHLSHFVLACLFFHIYVNYGSFGFNFTSNHQTVSKMTFSFYIPTSSVWAFQLLYFLA
jgi:hypothetical protein